jgi:hypothetical protein
VDSSSIGEGKASNALAPDATLGLIVFLVILAGSNVGSNVVNTHNDREAGSKYEETLHVPYLSKKTYF